MIIVDWAMGNTQGGHEAALLKASASYSNLNTNRGHQKKFNIYDKCNNLSNCDSMRRRKKSVSTSNLSYPRPSDTNTFLKNVFSGKLI